MTLRNVIDDYWFCRQLRRKNPKAPGSKIYTLRFHLSLWWENEWIQAWRFLRYCWCWEEWQQGRNQWSLIVHTPLVFFGMFQNSRCAEFCDDIRQTGVGVWVKPGKLFSIPPRGIMWTPLFDNRVHVNSRTGKVRRAIETHHHRSEVPMA